MNQKKPNKRRPQTKPAAGTQQSKAVREYTAGGVVWRRQGDEYQILMIQDRMGRWTIPKGHVEPGESLEQTALREVTEETGLADLRLGEKLDRLHFFYRKDGKLIFMTTTVFLMAAIGDTDKVVPEDSEGIVDAKWFGADDALRLVEYRDTERLFRLGLSRLQGGSAQRPGGAPRRRRRRRSRATAGQTTGQS